jgi:hypothetical protein
MNNMFFVGDKVEVLNSNLNSQHIGMNGVIQDEGWATMSGTLSKVFVVEFKDETRGFFLPKELMIL